MSFVQRITSKLSRSFVDAAFAAGFSGPIIGAGNNIIIMYHGVDSAGSTRFNTRHVGKACFVKQIAFLKKYCNVIPVADFFNAKFDAGKPNVAITFDDGYKNNFTNALPVFERYECPATFYITGMNEIGDGILWADYVNIAAALSPSGFTLRGEEFENRNGFYYSKDRNISLYEIVKNQTADYDYKRELYTELSRLSDFKEKGQHAEHWQLMRDEEIKKTAKSKHVTVGSHGYYHNNLGVIAIEKASEEIRKSKMYLENLIQYAIESIAYPDGSYSRPVVEFAAEQGIKYQVAADGFRFKEDKTDKRLRNRYGLYTCDSCANQLYLVFHKPAE